MDTTRINGIGLRYKNDVIRERFQHYKELYHEGALGVDDFYKLGRWTGRLNAEVIDGLHPSCLNYFHKNVFKRDTGEVLYIDLNKLYLTDFPQVFIDKYVITEDIVSFAGKVYT